MKNLIDKPLSELQRKFADLYVENLGANKLTNTQVAINAGYAPDSAYQRAYEMLNPRECPHVVKYIAERKAEFYKRNNIDTLISSVNKCLEGVPGFSFVIIKKVKIFFINLV